VVKDLVFEIHKGSKVAFVGPTGAGKATLMQLLPRVVDPTNGKITWDGVDLTTASRDSVRTQIVALPQDTFILNLTLYENILVGRPSASGEEVLEASRAAGLHAWISGLPNGFGNEFNDGLWRIGSSQGTLFLGSSDESNSWSFLPGITPSLNSIFGFDLFATQDGVHITQISHDGFHDGLNYGISRMTNTPFGMFIASANVQFGLGIWRNSILPSSFPAPQGLAIELSGNSPMLSWNAAAGAAKYRILRAPLVPYTLYPALFGNQTVTGEYEEIGTVTGTTFTDAPLGAGAQYLYMVQAEDASGKLSDPSNLAYAPPLQPPATFDGLRAQIERLRARKYFTQAASGDEARASLERARSVAAAGNFVDAALHLENVRRILSTEGLLKVPYGRSEALYAESLARRLTLVGQGKLSKNSRF
jgi:ABC-type sugar transport system ATPase subunit